VHAAKECPTKDFLWTKRRATRRSQGGRTLDEEKKEVGTKSEKETPEGAPEASTANEPGEAASATTVEAPSEEKEEKVPFEIVETKQQPFSVVEYKLRVPYEEYDKRLSDLLKELRSNVIIDGFRKGKAPLRLIKIQYGKQAKTDVVEAIFPICVAQLQKEQNLDLTRDPELKEYSVEEGKPLELTVSLEVKPKIELSPEDYKGVEVEIEEQPITDAALDQELERIRRVNAILESKTGGKVEPEDAIVVDVRVTDEHGRVLKPFTAKDQLIADFMQYFPESVGKVLVGKAAGDSVEIAVENERKDEQGEVVSKKDTFAIAIKEVKRVVLPKLDDEFAKDLGDYENLEQLQARVREELAEREKERQHNHVLVKIYQRLMEKVPFEPPLSLTRAYQAELIRQDIQRWRRLGLDLSDMAPDKEEYLKQVASDSLKTVTISLLLQEIAKRENITVTDEDLDKEIERIARMQNRKPLAVRAKLEAEKRLDALKEDLMTNKVAQFLIDNARIVKKPAA
jgi:trigger factor